MISSPTRTTSSARSHRQHITLALLVSISLISPITQALKTDKNQPMVVDAKEIEMDFRNGSRIYTGKVRAQQGSLKLDANKVELYLKNGSLDKGFAWGKPAVFRQRPDGKDTDVIGKARKIEIYQSKNLVILKGAASITQDGSTILGKIITYNMKTDRMKVRGNTKTIVQPGAINSSNPQASKKQQGKQTSAPKKQSTRPHMTFTPKKSPSKKGQ